MNNIVAAVIIGYYLLLYVALAGYITHIIVCIKAANYLLLIAGGIVFPVGVIHGIATWFGWW
ncbi:hypothetical protein [Bradyrhizobium sp. SZCCHNS3053]|uniref:hypothetical protein n=1 Tax=Bradyrhizobium sp. SZCCHNS3053 TaxID=3057322 RepID=UPI002915E252|nr:hypothetical protein [Bradyrhizobium sp. SZCCHNS3053]